MGNISTYAPELNVGTSTPVGGLLDIINEAKDFAGGFQQFNELVDEINKLIPREIQSVVRNPKLFSANGNCIRPSKAFSDYTYELLSDEIDVETLDEYNPCNYLTEIQQGLRNTTEVVTSVVTVKDLVKLPSNLESTLARIFGEDIQFDGEALLGLFGKVTLRRMMDFIRSYLGQKENGSSRRLGSINGSPYVQAGPSRTKKRSNLMGNLRRSRLPSLEKMDPHRALSDVTILSFDVNDFLTLGFGFNIGGGKKEIKIIVDFKFDSSER
eukprot:10682912-Ditylum_brightwellii.AAC.1